MNTSKQAKSKETNIVTQTDLLQLANDTIEDEFSVTNNEGEVEYQDQGETEAEAEGGDEDQGQDQDQGETEAEAEVKDQDQGETEAEAEGGDEDQGQDQDQGKTEAEAEGGDEDQGQDQDQGETEAEGGDEDQGQDQDQGETEAEHQDRDQNRGEGGDEDQTSIAQLSKTDITSITSSKYKSSNKSKRYASSRQSCREFTHINLSKCICFRIKLTQEHIETSMTTINQYFESTDEGLMINLDSTNIAAVIEVVSENIPEQQPTIKFKKRKKRVFKPREEFYYTRSRT